ncbi:MAG TPA: stage V sporulation protein D, partial [Clostridiaceae bacterium]|nr:stage V sporulation protein D [Clostridiaceae bacterium]HCL51142.1 stage V sporulation protein D [Clostridiaceae bacterium]
GSDVVLTIDQSIQYFTEKVIEKGLKEYKAKQISAIVMDVKTGEILAMANKPDYDPNEPVKGDVTSSMALWKNRAVNDSF